MLAGHANQINNQNLNQIIVEETKIDDQTKQKVHSRLIYFYQNILLSALNLKN